MHCDYCSMLPKETQRWITAVPNVAPVAWSYDYYHVLFDWEKEDHALIRLLFCWSLSWLLVLYWFVAFFQAFLLSMKCIGYNGESLMDTFVWWHKNFHMCCTYSVSASYKALIKFMFEGLLGKSNYSEHVMTCELALPAISDGGLCRRQADGGGTASKSFCPLRLLTIVWPC